MNKLLSANFTRLFKDKGFRISMIFMVLCGAVLPVLHYISEKRTGYEIPLDEGFYIFGVFIIILSAVFTALFVGTEYSDGTIRNKVIVGHTRSGIYAANLIVCLTAAVLMCVAYLIPYLFVGIPLLGFFEKGIAETAFHIFCIFLLGFAATAVFVAMGMLNQNKAVVTAICILSSFILLFAGIYIAARLSEPKTYPAYIFTDGDTGETGEETEEPNPHYVGGTKRKAYEFFNDFLPGGQAIQLSSSNPVHTWMIPVYSLIIVLCGTSVGVSCFQRKDLK